MKYGIKYVSIKQSKEEIEKHGYRNFRQVIFQFIDSLPLTNQTLNNWIINANSNGNEFLVNSIKANIDISRIFHNETINISSPSYFKTIHSVKGMSLEAILVFIIKESASKNYSTIFSRRYNEPDINKEEKTKKKFGLSMLLVHVQKNFYGSLFLLTTFKGIKTKSTTMKVLRFV